MGEQYDRMRFPLGPRYDRHGKINLMSRAGGYCMARRPRCIPFVLTEKQWLKLDAEPWSEDRIAAAKAKERKRQEESERMVRFLMGGRRDVT